MEIIEIFDKIEEIIKSESHNLDKDVLVSEKKDEETESGSEKATRRNSIKEIFLLMFHLLLNVVKAPFKFMYHFLKDELIAAIKKDIKLYVLIIHKSARVFLLQSLTAYYC